MRISDWSSDVCSSDLEITMIPDLDCAVLLPIDIQRGFDDPRWPRRWNPDFEANALALLGGWRAIGRPIIHVRHDSVEPGSSLAPGQPGNRFRPGRQDRRRGGKGWVRTGGYRWAQ